MNFRRYGGSTMLMSSNYPRRGFNNGRGIRGTARGRNIGRFRAGRSSINYLQTRFAKNEYRYPGRPHQNSGNWMDVHRANGAPSLHNARKNIRSLKTNVNFKRKSNDYRIKGQKKPRPPGPNTFIE
ncbi:hypothetical protein MHBO_001615 [Bonamia ostreae]|uniref:Ribosomal protein L2 n=1 Tax=Bonamia ostreae TaxID=126728 RepID=A0ABV2AJL9_9EUKA